MSVEVLCALIVVVPSTVNVEGGATLQLNTGFGAGTISKLTSLWAILKLLSPLRIIVALQVPGRLAVTSPDAATVQPEPAPLNVHNPGTGTGVEVTTPASWRVLPTSRLCVLPGTKAIEGVALATAIEQDFVALYNAVVPAAVAS